MDIRIKDYKIIRVLMDHIYHPKLTALAVWAAARYSIIMFTSAYRAGDPGVHGTTPCRALDIRSTWYESPQKIVDDINNHWEYDQSRPSFQCALLHDIGKGMHIHLQVCAQTQYHENGRQKNDVAIAGIDSVPSGG